ncbi:hypothetical protein ABUE34_05835 [Kozakia baliensis]|uniref:hypothetical protein n=1 Tax=Kozakia baliensis TaxID=153496 RepID=UPI00345C4991
MMGHNYAKPATVDGRLARLLARIPDEWGVEIERPGGGGWSVSLHPPGGEVTWGMPQPTLQAALEEIWRLVGPPGK